MSSRSNIIVSIVIVALVFSSIGAYVFLTNQYVPPQIAIIVEEPGFGDMSMADQVLEGLEELGGDITCNYTYRVAADADDAQYEMDQLASTRRYDLIVVIGQSLQDRLQIVAANHPNQRFAIIGGSVSGSLTNVVSATFAQEQGAFLAGVLAAFISQNGSKVIGILASRDDDPTVADLIAGFTQGLETANTTYDLGVSLLPVEYVGSYNDTATANATAVDMFDPNDGNASVIFAPVRASIMGVRHAILAANRTWFGNDSWVGYQDREPFVIAAEGNQDYIGLRNIEIRSGDDSWFVTSVVPRTDLAVYRIINSTLWDEFEGGSAYAYNLTNSNVDITEFEFSSSWISQDLRDTLAMYRTGIMNGSIIVNDGS